jgi:hypothetical protein
MGTIAYTAKRDIETLGPALSITDAFTSAADDSINALSSVLSGFVQDQWVQVSGFTRSSGWYQVKANSTSGKILTLTPPIDHLRLPGVAGNFASTPDSAAASVTGSIELTARAVLPDWTQSGNWQLIGKDDASTNRDYVIFIGSAGTLNFQYTSDGVTTSGRIATSSAPVPFVDGVIGWFKATYNSGSGVVQFFTSTDGVVFTQLGTNITITSGAIHNGTGALFVGNSLVVGSIYYAEVRNGIGGPIVAAFDPTRASRGATTFVAATGETWTINSSGTPPALLQGPQLFDEGAEYLSIPGIAGNNVTTPDSAAVSFTGDIDFRSKIAPNLWATGSGSQAIIVKDNVGSNYSYAWVMDLSGFLSFFWTENGTALKSATSTAAVGFSAGSAHWVRVTFDVNNGASGRTFVFYTSDDYDPTTGLGTWTQLGATVTQATATSIFDGTSPVELGTESAGLATFFSGKYYYAEMRNGINGTVAAVFNPGRAAAGATSVVSYTGETWTINTSGGTPAALVRTTPVLITGYKRGFGQTYQLEFYSEVSDRSAKAIRASQTALGGGQPEVVYTRREVRMAVTALGPPSGDLIDETSMPQWREMLASSFAGEVMQFDRYGTIAVPGAIVPAVLDDDGYQEARIGPSKFKLSFNLLLLT